MIKKETIDLILDTARIEEVVGDFVNLKKRGVNLLGLCPFHNEKTPSFNVSPTRGIYKCFGCGKAGNSVNFIMEHEHYSYPEALRYLATKYQIPIEEEQQSPEFTEEQMLRESLLVVTDFARKFFSKQLWDSDEGKSIGLSYFYERDFTDAIIEKFQLGYAPDSMNALRNEALESGFKEEFLEKTGLMIVNENKKYDRFRGRVIFPIHNVTGKTIAFGARILKTDPKAPKYLNSPETEIYHKSQILYGIFFAKKSIIAKDECYLVEGYTDVISMHMAGIENVVASSGTSLTTEQIRLIARYTKNITVLYDGDPAGIKASLRGIDMILEEGLNVKVVLFPDGDDPDSYARKHSSYEVAEYITNSARDFISFKTSLLLKDVANDPVRKAGLIRDIVETIAKIPDQILRSQYVRQCATLMEISEQVLLSELNKILRKNISRNHQETAPETFEIPDELLLPDQPLMEDFSSHYQEADIIRLLINFGDHDLHFEEPINDRETQYITEKVRSLIVHEITSDNITLENPLFNEVFSEFEKMVHAGNDFELQKLVNHEKEEVRSLVADMLAVKHMLSDGWREKGVRIKTEEQRLKHAVMSAVYAIKIKHISKLIRENSEAIKNASANDEDIDELLKQSMLLDRIKKELSAYLSIVVLK